MLTRQDTIPMRIYSLPAAAAAATATEILGHTPTSECGASKRILRVSCGFAIKSLFWRSRRWLVGGWTDGWLNGADDRGYSHTSDL